MKYTKENLSAFSITGIKTRTDNVKAYKDISDLWEKFYAGNYSAKIPNKVSEDIVSLYTEYESDHNGPYSVIIGCKVNDQSGTPADMVSKTIPASDFAVFTAKGKMPQAIVDTWKEIWDTKIDRTYTGDFELFDEKYSSDDPEAKIYIAIK